MPKEKLAEVSYDSHRKTDENCGNGNTSRAVPPVAWALICGECVDSTFTDRDEAVEWASGIIPPAQIVPLYRHPQPTLTDAEREAVETAVWEADAHQHTRRAATLRGLLERLA